MNDVATCCVIDTEGLHELFRVSDNMRAIILAKLADGTIGVPTIVWNEFEEIYPEEALTVVEHVTNKIRMKPAYHHGAAGIADGLNSGFPRGSHDQQTDLYTAAVANCEGYTVLTAEGATPHYENFGCNCFDLETWVAALDGEEHLGAPADAEANAVD
jgi:hypothetical protein